MLSPVIAEYLTQLSLKPDKKKILMDVLLTGIEMKLLLRL